MYLLIIACFVNPLPLNIYSIIPSLITNSSIYNFFARNIDWIEYLTSSLPEIEDEKSQWNWSNPLPTNSLLYFSLYAFSNIGKSFNSM